MSAMDQIIRNHLISIKTHLLQAIVLNKKILYGAVNAFNKQQTAYLQILIDFLVDESETNVNDSISYACEVDFQIYYKNGQPTQYLHHCTDIQNQLRNACKCIQLVHEILQQHIHQQSTSHQTYYQHMLQTIIELKQNVDSTLFYQTFLLNTKLDCRDFVKECMFEAWLNINRKANFDRARDCNEELGRELRTHYLKTKREIKLAFKLIDNLLNHMP